jgi:hypothetical protein
MERDFVLMRPARKIWPIFPYSNSLINSIHRYNSPEPLHLHCIVEDLTMAEPQSGVQISKKAFIQALLIIFFLDDAVWRSDPCDSLWPVCARG